MDVWIYSALTLVYLILVIHMTVDLTRRKQWITYFTFQLIVSLSLAYDNGIIAAGNTIGEGERLIVLSSLRFWLHAFATPLLILVSYQILRSSGTTLAKNSITNAAAWLITIGLVIYQIVAFTLSEVKNLTPIEEYGVLRYMAEGHAGPPIMVIIVGFILLFVGLIVFIKRKGIWMFVGTTLLFVGQLINLQVESGALTNVCELILMLSIWKTTTFVWRINRR
ncbi:hypothetical protein JNUCC31_29085 [Paenibacillus sp. JNUCC31]|uniref:hypothetical protein n=1 Tax=Paenibacillus sp. JNUCC-31 TaxID=2777983 RepID=UPI001786A6EA|nr:hypothetical protein [Paenibacillus sp. JNUCC-31]QOS78708.1 hypothetical protein JNUCC31_29085 [Paenibacillus sp. JNUCC-31]